MTNPVPQARSVGLHLSGGADTYAILGATLGLWVGVGNHIVPSSSGSVAAFALPRVCGTTVEGVPILWDSVRVAVGPA